MIPHETVPEQTPIAAPPAVAEWLDERRTACDMQVRLIPIPDSLEWEFDGDRLRHKTGGYFQVVGVQRAGDRDQPLIDQPEIGILGFLVRDKDGSREISLQAKPEPGNVGLVQLAPTVQATESNYKQLHKGLPTPLLSHFLNPRSDNVLADSLQSEQGSRFLAKRNRNMVVLATTVEDHSHESLRWFQLKDLLALLVQDYAVNTDARSVLTVCPWDELAPQPFERWRNTGLFGEKLLESYHAAARISDSELTSQLEAVNVGSTSVVALSELSEWSIGQKTIENSTGSAFYVCQVDVTTSQREVEHWDQPLFAAKEDGHVVLLCRDRDGVLEFGFRPRHEIGFVTGAQFGPSIQESDEEVPPATPLVSCMHSDEGGRFYLCSARYEISLLAGVSEIETELTWMPLSQVARLIQREGLFTNEARSLVSMLLSYL